MDEILEQIGAWLDIPDSYFVKARARYQSIGNWLERSGSAVAQLNPTIFPQGSFSLGTVTKPTTDKDEYDIDLVCKLDGNKRTMTQKQLKDLVGGEIKAYADAHNMSAPPQERRRCWRLDYADGASFHADILPSIPDPSPNFDQAIALTDNQHPHYARICEDWPCSNPADYAAWFRGRMEGRLQIMREMMAKALKARAEDVPEYRIKTPLQRAVQLLKRHRDMTYDGDPDDKPISVLITTLAGLAYDNEATIVEALISIVTTMEEHIEDHDGVLWVANPVNPDENFADKWQEYPERKTTFMEWLERVRLEVLAAILDPDLPSALERLRACFGDSAVNSVERDLNLLSSPNPMLLTRASATDKSVKQFAVPHRQPPRWKMQLDDRLYVRVSARVSRNGFRPKTLLADCDAAIPKHCSLQFTANSNAGKAYDVYWQVVNTGQEAKSANTLRGDFYSSTLQKGRKIRQESTLYKGMHWVECFVVKDDICIARSGEFIVNIG